MDIGYHLKKLRKEKNYTLNEVADKTEMSISLLSQVENDKALPSLTSLQVLLRFYGVGLSAFFNQVERNDYLVIKKKNAERFSDKSGKVILTFLASKLQNTSKVSYKAILGPESELKITELDENISGERFIFVISGSIEVVLKDESSIHLTNEDSLIFRSFIPCIIINKGPKSSQMLISGTPPIF
jgi:transcriptional regulator with XRE-family HTH domain